MSGRLIYVKEVYTMSSLFYAIGEKIVFNDTNHEPYSKESLVRRALILGISEEDVCEIFDISIDVAYEQSRKNLDVIDKVIKLYNNFINIEEILNDEERYHTFAINDVPSNVFTKILGVDYMQLKAVLAIKGGD